jgi:UDP-glucuronate 4-epimerase
MKSAFITGAAGFVGFHLAHALLREGWAVSGYDAMTDYYDVGLKQARLDILGQFAEFRFTKAMLEDAAALQMAAASAKPDVIVHLAAQAGVRYSLDNPQAYISANIVGTFNLMEAARQLRVGHLLMASTSSVYGANTDMPFDECQKADTPLTIYAATKKATEAMGHAYAHLHNMPTTMFRFFTVYGPWGRPDMAPMKFAKGILSGAPIDVYNNGQMWRDFTYVDDLVRGIRGLIDAPPTGPKGAVMGDSLSPAAPFRVVNIGNSEKINLMDFIAALEDALGRKAQLNLMPMQTGDVPATWANADLLHRLTGYRPQTPLREGVAQFVRWYQTYYAI